jgi:peptidoglycan pentaglycine glycine transferase (the first glycine)
MSDATAWDDALDPGAHLLQSYRWGELQQRFGWEVDRRRVDVDGATVPVSIMTTPTLTPGGRWGYVPKGPAVPAEKLARTLSAMAPLTQALDLAYLRVEPDVDAGFSAPSPWRAAPATQPEHTSVIDLRQSAEELLAGFKPKTRYNIRLAEKKGVRVEVSDDAGAFATLAEATSARHRIQLADEPYYRAVLELLGADDMAWLLLAYHHDESSDPLAGIVVTRFHGRATYLFGASRRAGRELMPAYLLHWAAIQQLKAKGDHEYDLWGTPPPDAGPDHPWAGLRQFKSGWNGRDVTFAGAYDVVTNVTTWRADRALAKIRGNVRRVRSKLRR